MDMYYYNGPVFHFGKEYVQCHNFEGYTYATSLPKAINNFTYRAKKKLGLEPNADLTIDPTLVSMVETRNLTLEPRKREIYHQITMQEMGWI